MFLYITINTDAAGKVAEIKQSHQTSLPILASSKLISQCSACQSQVTINLILHDPQAVYLQMDDDSNQNIKTEPDIEIDQIAYGCSVDDSNFPLGSDLLIDQRVEAIPLQKIRKNRLKKRPTPKLTTKNKTNKTSEHLCVYCLKLFDRYSTLISHQRNHDLTCSMCKEPSSFPSKLLLKAHVHDQHHNLWPEGYRLDACPHCKTKVDVARMQTHLQGCNSVKDDAELPAIKVKKKRSTRESLKGVTCIYCFEIFPDGPAVRRHYIVHDLFCKFCGPDVAFHSKKPLLRHIRENHFDQHPKSAGSQVCEKCGKEFTRIGLKFHVRTCAATSNGAPHCPICKKTFIQWNSVRQHIEVVHEGKRRFTCELCGLQFTSKVCLETHYVTHQYSDDPEPFKCELCPGRSFRMRRHIRDHMLNEHLKLPRRRYICDECGNSYPRPSKLKDHMRKHLELRPFKCSYCSKSFYQNGAKTAHEKIHTDVRPYPCEVCGQRFRQRQGMTSHMRLHTGEKPYECEVCHQRFSDRGCYRSHLTKHEKDMGITLDKSVKKFAVKSDMNKN